MRDFQKMKNNYYFWIEIEFFLWNEGVAPLAFPWQIPIKSPKINKKIPIKLTEKGLKWLKIKQKGPILLYFGLFLMVLG